MVMTRWTLGVSVLAMAIFAASDARALTAYVSEGPAASGALKCCAGSSAAGHQVGCFSLTDVEHDQSAVCDRKGGVMDFFMSPVKTVADVAWAPISAAGAIAGGLAEIVADQAILAKALVNEPYVLLTMPYRKSEPMN